MMDLRVTLLTDGPSDQVLLRHLTWLLFDERAIRQAAGNPHGDPQLSLPKLNAIENLADPKQDLHRILRDASGLSGRRRKRFSDSNAARRVAELIDDFSPLRALSAFQAVENEVVRVIDEYGWG